MLSEAEIRHYHDDGFVIPDFRMPDGVLASIRERHARLLQRNPEFRNYCPALLLSSTSASPSTVKHRACSTWWSSSSAPTSPCGT